MNFKKSKNVNGCIRLSNAKKRMSLMLFAVVFSALSITAQNTPEPPTPPSSSNAKSSNSSVSISISNDEYKFRARYDQVKNEGVKTLLLNQLGEKYLKIKGDTYLWSNPNNGDDNFECKLTKGHLKMYLNTTLASSDFNKKIKTLGNDLKHYISGSNPEEEIERAQRDLQRAEQELKRAQRQAKQAVRIAKRAARN